MIEPPTDGTERVLMLRLSSIQGHVILVCVYAPALQATAEVKDQFYESLDTVISRIPAVEHIYLLGDFNAQVGADHESWPDVLGHHGIGKATLLLSQAVHDEYLFPEQGMPQSLLETSKVKTLASAGHDHYQARLPEQRLQHQVLPQCRL